MLPCQMSDHLPFSVVSLRRQLLCLTPAINAPRTINTTDCFSFGDEYFFSRKLSPIKTNKVAIRFKTPYIGMFKLDNADRENPTFKLYNRAIGKSLKGR